MFDWFANTLRQYPEIAIFISLALGYYFGSFTYKGLGLGAVTATLVAAVIIGQLGITVTGPLKSFFFLMFLFAIGYGVGPQFVRGIAKDGLPQALYAAVVCVFCLLSAYLAAKFAGCAVGSAVIIALLGPALLGINLEAACKQYEEKHGGGNKVTGGPGTAWHQFGLRAFRIREGARIAGKTVQDAELLLPDQRVYVQRIRRGDELIEATSDTVIQAGDVVAVAGRRDVLVDLIGSAAEEVDDRELLAVPTEGLDVYVTAKKVDGQTLAELAQAPWARGVFLRKITR